MSRSDVVLISPPPHLTSGKYASLGGSEHLGLGYLAASLELAGYSVEILTIEGSGWSLFEVVKMIAELNPCLIGLSPTSHSMEWTEEFCQLYKRSNNTLIAVGGHLATHMGKQILENNKDIDIICVYDGERVIYEIVYNIKNGINDFSNINNLVYRNTKKDIIATQVEIASCDLNLLPWPKHHFLEKGTTRILTSRGCVYDCNFCTTPAFYQRNVRHRDIADVIEEMVELNKRYCVNRFFFSDDSFIDNSRKSIARIEKFIDGIQRNLLDIEFRCEIRADVIIKNQDLVKKLYDVGMKYLFVGFESCVESELNYFNKRINLPTILSVPHIVKQIGISVVPGFIMYNSHTTFDDLREKIEFLYKNNYLYRTTLFARTCMGYPGSTYFNDMKRLGAYDKSRSNTYLLYPDFVVHGIKALSVAFEKIEYAYLKLDSMMLNSVIYHFDNYVLRKESLPKKTTEMIIQATRVLENIQDVYYTLYLKSLSIAESETEKNAIEQIIDLFQSQLDFLQSKVDLFSHLIC